MSEQLNLPRYLATVKTIFGYAVEHYQRLNTEEYSDGFLKLDDLLNYFNLAVEDSIEGEGPNGLIGSLVSDINSRVHISRNPGGPTKQEIYFADCLDELRRRGWVETYESIERDRIGGNTPVPVMYYRIRH